MSNDSHGVRHGNLEGGESGAGGQGNLVVERADLEGRRLHSEDLGNGLACVFTR